MFTRPSAPVIAAILVVSHSLAFITTVSRLWHRKQRSRLWWDDFWAFIALLFDTFLWIVTIAAPMGTTQHYMSRSLRTFAKLGGLSAYTTALWASRVSIAVTIVRLLNPGKFRDIAKTATVLFGLFWLTLVIQKIFPCGLNTPSLSWCPIPRVTGYIELTTDTLADTWLILAPSYMLWTIKISHCHRRLIFSIFACSVLTIGACVAHIYFILSKSYVWTGITAHIQTGVSIAVCNLLVLVTYIYRAIFNGQKAADTAIRNGAHARDQSSGAELEGTSPGTNGDEMSVPPTERHLSSPGSSFGNTLNVFPSIIVNSQWSDEPSYQSRSYSLAGFPHATV